MLLSGRSPLGEAPASLHMVCGFIIGLTDRCYTRVAASSSAFFETLSFRLNFMRGGILIAFFSAKKSVIQFFWMTL